MLDGTREAASKLAAQKNPLDTTRRGEVVSFPGTNVAGNWSLYRRCPGNCDRQHWNCVFSRYGARKKAPGNKAPREERDNGTCRPVSSRDQHDKSLHSICGLLYVKSAQVRHTRANAALEAAADKSSGQNRSTPEPPLGAAGTRGDGAVVTKNAIERMVDRYLDG
jgi:hypothetical protein